MVYSGTSGTTANVWPMWTNSATTITTAATQIYSTQMTWSIWTGSTTTTGVSNTITSVDHHWPRWVEQASGRQISREELAAAQARARAQTEEWERKAATERKLRTEANDRAERILRESLTPKQCEDLAARGYFDLETIRPTGERKLYRIRRGRSRNIEEIDPASQRRIKTLCAHPIALVPDADTMLVQKLMLEASEEDFLRIANVS